MIFVVILFRLNWCAVSKCSMKYLMKHPNKQSVARVNRTPKGDFEFAHEDVLRLVATIMKPNWLNNMLFERKTHEKYQHY